MNNISCCYTSRVQWEHSENSRFFGHDFSFGPIVKVVHNDEYNNTLKESGLKRTLMQNRLNTFIINICVNAVNTVNYFNKTWSRVAPARTMDLYSLDKFKKYKNDWNYPIQVRSQQQVAPDKESNTFQSAMKLTLTIGQYFGLNPVLGVREKNALKLRFKYTSLLCIYTYVSIVGQLTMTSLLLIGLYKDTSTIVDSANAVIFYSFGVLTTLQFLRIAMKWPKLCMEIHKMEVADRNTNPKLNRKFNICCIIVLSMALIEHVLSELRGITLAIDCDPELPLYEGFIRHSFPWIFAYIPYYNGIGILFHFINMQCSFNWNYSSLFVICMSFYLTSRLEQINQRVVAAKNKRSPCSFWRTLREDYNRSVELVREMDNIVGGIVFISFACNLFFVCSQLLHTLAGGIKATPKCRPDTLEDHRTFHGYEHPVYFCFSFVFLVARALAVSLTAARVHSASKEPAHALYNVSSTAYCVEIERFLDQIHGDTVALSGLQFFYVKRGLVLTIAGTIVTYELVLMQFTGVTPSPPENDQ